MENYYSILECSSTATPEELKRNYQRLAKKHHPDKETGSTEIFLLIDKAYKTLKDSQLRKDYDSTILAVNCQDQPLIYAEIEKKDIVLNEEGVWTFSCRCGEQFIIEQEHLNESECVMECSECSNCILIR